MNRTFLAIDYGRKRVGLAKSDPMGVIASALETLEVKSMADTVAKVSAVIDEVEPDALVVGYPLLPSGDKSEMCAEVDRFVEKLKLNYAGPVHLVDEIYSSDQAKEIVKAHGSRVGKDKKRIDRLAAVMILQRYLDEQQ